MLWAKSSLVNSIYKESFFFKVIHIMKVTLKKQLVVTFDHKYITIESKIDFGFYLIHLVSNIIMINRDILILKKKIYV